MKELTPVQRSQKNYKLKSNYGIDLEAYSELLAAQGGRCAICGVVPEDCERNFAVDHDHACCPGAKSCGGCVRGLLCARCNFLLGYARDDTEVLASAMRYLCK